MKSNKIINTRLTAYNKKPSAFLPQTENGFYVEAVTNSIINIKEPFFKNN